MKDLARLNEIDPLPPLSEPRKRYTDDDFHQSFDARDWADAFCRINPGFDNGCALAWFANALMRGWDERSRRPDEEQAEALQRLREEAAEYRQQAGQGDRRA